MSKTLQWVIGISIILIAITVIASSILPFLLPQAAWGGWQGMMGPGHMFGGGGMTGGFGMPFFGLGMITMLLWPVLIIGLIVLGVVWLVRSIGTPAAPQPPAAAIYCSNCSKPLQPGWKACPYCGEKVMVG